MAPIKFAFKKNVDVVSPLPKLYKALPIICFMAVLCILVALTPQAFYVPALASLIAIVGLLKDEEILYVLMGALSKSVMSSGCRFLIWLKEQHIQILQGLLWKI